MDRRVRRGRRRNLVRSAGNRGLLYVLRMAVDGSNLIRRALSLGVGGLERAGPGGSIRWMGDAFPGRSGALHVGVMLLLFGRRFVIADFVFSQVRRVLLRWHEGRGHR